MLVRMAHRHLLRPLPLLVMLAAVLVNSCGSDKGGTEPDKPVAAVTITGAPTSPQLAGTVTILNATPRDASGKALLGRAVAWASSDSQVAKVTAEGTVTGVGPGTVSITATSETITQSVSLEYRTGGVLGADGGTISVMGGALSLIVQPAGLSQATVVLVRRAPAGPVPVNLVAGTAFEVTPATQSFGASMASIGIRFPGSIGFDSRSLKIGVFENGAWHLVDGGTADPVTHIVWAPITKLGTYAIIAAAVDHLTLSGVPADGKLFLGQAVQLSVQAFDVSDNPLTGRQVVWSSSDSTIAAVSPFGRVSAVRVGSAEITATVEGKSVSATFITKVVPVALVSITPISPAMYPRQLVTLAATTRDSIGGLLSGRSVSWKSSDESKATVDAAGVVHALAPGTVTITATSEGVSGTAAALVLDEPTVDWSQAAEWTTFQGNAAHDGHVAATANPADFRQLWTVPLGGTPNPVTVGAGRVFVSTNSYFGTQLLKVLDANTGTTQWIKDFGGIHGVHSPAYGNGAVYVTTSGQGDSFLWGFDAATGEVRIRSAYGNQWERYFAPVVTADAVYMAGGYYGGMYAFNIDGSQRWFVQTNQYDMWTPAVRDGVVYGYTGDNDPKLTAVSAVDGTQLFAIPDPSFSWDGWSMNVALALGSQQDAMATHDGRLISFDLANHQIRWQRAGSYRGQVTIAAGAIYVVANGQVEARKESDGSLLWIWVPPEGSAMGQLVVTDNLLLVSTAANTYALDIGSHRQVWSYAAGGSLTVSSEGTLFIARSDGKLSAVALK
jgi:uncharacterized protein YjdB